MPYLPRRTVELICRLAMRYLYTFSLLVFTLLLSMSPLSTDWTANSAPGASAEPPTTDSLIIEARELLHEGMSAADRGTMERARAQFERATADDDYAALAHYYAGLANYRLASIFLEADDVPVGDYLEAAADHLETATDLDDQCADAYALRSSVYGMKISQNPLRAMTLGRTSSETMERALELEPKNPRVVLLSAQSDFHTPGMFGGDRDEALDGFKRAAELFEEESPDAPLQPQWGHEEAYAWVGIAHSEEGRYDEAEAAFERALEINPSYGWVRYELLPEVAGAGPNE